MEIQDIIRPENKVYSKPELLEEVHMHYCPGCSHGVIHKLLAEVIAEMGLAEKTIGVSPVGCAVFAYNYIDVDWVEAAHGRAPTVATAVSRLRPENVVFTYQGDGDTCRPSAPQSRCTPRTEGRTSSWYSSTTPSTA